MMMTAIEILGGAGPASALRPTTAEAPQPGPGQLLIEVKAAGVNRPDLMQRMGLYPPPQGASPILGLEVAGRVAVAAGRWRVGDQVCALVNGGGYAEYVVCDARHALPIPDGLTLTEAAGLPETAFTTYANVMEHGRLQAGESLLVHGATSGIGVMAIQIAKAAGARVIATARGEQKAEAALSLGADVAIDTSLEDFAPKVAEAGGADVILEMVGGDYVPRDLAVLKPDGRIVFIAAQAGNDLSLPIFTLMQKRAVITGSTLRGRSDDEKARLAEQVERVVWPWVTQGQVKPQVSAVFPLAEAAAAHARLEEGRHTGKLILTL